MYNGGLVDISAEHKNYIVGFFHGDGHYYIQSRNRGRISVELNIRDIDILDKIEDIIVDVKRSTKTRDTNFKKNYKSCKLSIYKKEIRDFFNIPLGKKTNIIEPPTDVIVNHYIRGLFDADGSLGMTGKNIPFWSLTTSSEKVKEFILLDIKNRLNIEKHINRNKRDNVYNIMLINEYAVDYTSMLYHNATIYLDRKYNKFLEMCKWERTTPKRTGRSKRWLPYEDKVVLTDLLLKEKMKLLDRSASSIKTRAWRLKQ